MRFQIIHNQVHPNKYIVQQWVKGLFGHKWKTLYKKQSCGWDWIDVCDFNSEEDAKTWLKEYVERKQHKPKVVYACIYPEYTTVINNSNLSDEDLKMAFPNLGKPTLIEEKV